MRKTTSYQRRSGRLSSNQKSQLADSSFFLRSNDAFQQMLASEKPQSLTLEIGFGMGEHLLEDARQHPHMTFIGIDIYRPGIASVLQSIDAEQQSNCYVMEGDAVDLLSSFSQIRFHQINIHHPDPWPKKRHKKRQLLQKSFMIELVQLLGKSGKLQIITDDFDYFEHILEQAQSLASSTLILTIERDRLPNSKYGRKAAAEGREINAIELQRRD